jgi:hypothetical protein
MALQRALHASADPPTIEKSITLRPSVSLLPSSVRMIPPPPCSDVQRDKENDPAGKKTPRTGVFKPPSRRRVQKSTLIPPPPPILAKTSMATSSNDTSPPPPPPRRKTKENETKVALTNASTEVDPILPTSSVYSAKCVPPQRPGMKTGVRPRAPPPPPPPSKGPQEEAHTTKDSTPPDEFELELNGDYAATQAERDKASPAMSNPACPPTQQAQKGFKGAAQLAKRTLMITDTNNIEDGCEEPPSLSKTRANRDGVAPITGETPEFSSSGNGSSIKQRVLKVKVTVLDLQGIAVTQKQSKSDKPKKPQHEQDTPTENDAATRLRAVVSFSHASDVLDLSGGKIETHLTSLPMSYVKTVDNCRASIPSQAIWDGDKAVDGPGSGNHLEAGGTSIIASVGCRPFLPETPFGTTFELGRIQKPTKEEVLREDDEDSLDQYLKSGGSTNQDDSHTTSSSEPRSRRPNKSPDAFAPDFIDLPISFLKDGKMIPFGLATIVVTGLYRKPTEAQVVVQGVSSSNMSSFLHLTPKQRRKIAGRMMNKTSTTSFSFPGESTKYKTGLNCKLRVRINVAEEELLVPRSRLPKSAVDLLDSSKPVVFEVNAKTATYEMPKAQLSSVLRICKWSPHRSGAHGAIEKRPSQPSPPTDSSFVIGPHRYGKYSPGRLHQANASNADNSPDSVMHTDDKNVRFAQIQQQTGVTPGANAYPRVHFVPFNPHDPKETPFRMERSSSTYTRSFLYGYDLEDNVYEDDFEIEQSNAMLDRCENFLGLTPFFEQVEFRLFGCHAGSEGHRDFFARCEDYPPSSDFWGEPMPRCRVLLMENRKKMAEQGLLCQDDDVEDGYNSLLDVESLDDSSENLIL